MLITIKNNGKGAQGVYANGSTKPEFIRSGGSKRLTVTEEELERIVRIRTLAVRRHEGEDPAKVDDAGVIIPTVETDAADLVPEGDDTVEHPVLDEGDDEGENTGGQQASSVDDKPWEKPGRGSKKK
jgi:hypothetical protein